MNTYCVMCRHVGTTIVVRGGCASAHIRCERSGERRTHLMPGESHPGCFERREDAPEINSAPQAQRASGADDTRGDT